LVQRKGAVRKVLAAGKVSIPKRFLLELGLKEGDLVIIELQEKHVKIVPAEVRPRATRTRRPGSPRQRSPIFESFGKNKTST